MPSIITSSSIPLATLYLNVDLFPLLTGLVKKRFPLSGPCFLCFCILFGLADISVKSLGYLFSSKKKKEFHWSPPLKAIIAID